MFGRKRKAPSGDPQVAAESAIGAADVADSAASDAELAAVIAAAVTAFRNEGAAGGVIYRKIDRTAGPRTAWNLAGLREALASREL
jgi:hypothetical protein